MSPEKVESTFSAETANSKHWTAIVDLGERIVADLGMTESVDTLGRWMAHRVAELIEDAQAGNDEAKEEATNLILRLWAHRSHWPQGWPPPEMEGVRRQLDPSPYSERPGIASTTTPWSSRLADLKQLEDGEYRSWLRMALAESPLDEEILLTEELEDHLSEHELSFMKMVALNRKRAVDHFARQLNEADSTTARADMLRQDLDDIEAARRRLFDEALAEAAGAPDE